MALTRTLHYSLLLISCALFPERVEGQKPMIDPKSTTPAQTLTSEELNKIPAGRNIKDLLKVMPGVPAPGYSSRVGEAPGVNLIHIDGPSENLVFYLPKVIIQGHTFTATGVSRPVQGGERKFNQFVGQWQNGRFYWSVNGFDGEILKQANGEFALNLTQQSNNLRYSYLVPVQPADTPPPVALELPTSGTAGNPLEIHYPTTGVLAPSTHFRIGGHPAPILTATPGSIVILNNYNTPGLTEIETNIGNLARRFKFRNITLRLAADKTNLTKGEITPLRIEVAGLANLRAPAWMTVDATGVINMSGGNSQSFRIPTSDIGPDGIYRLSRTLTGTSAGGFGVKVTVTVGKEDF